ncbi:hypothetical protein QR721_11665 [Aciduricibacillus chroicocephali]|uniref:Uncharacterized protein n=1 Tax=Aciduricibacillus chroicocephali TaxID=3054939 RepID=A0ABY9KVJ6_9BACI|nr:hypothetical protein QR721_11665 [Bacillaceae bacterium 44XB]
MLEKDYEVLRGPFLSGRQRPDGLAGTMLLAIPLQVLMLFCVYVVAADETIYPYKDALFKLHFIITAAIMGMSVLMVFSKVHLKFQKIQYALSIAVTQNLFCITPYLIFLFLVGGMGISIEELRWIMWLSIGIGLMIFVAVCIRFYFLLKAGKYRKGSDRDYVRSRLEGTSFKGIAIVGGTEIVFIMQYVLRNSSSDLNSLMIASLAIVIAYVTVFILPEQLVILYCKSRFSSFSFDRRGELYPIGFDEKYGKRKKKVKV